MDQTKSIRERKQLPWGCPECVGPKAVQVFTAVPMLSPDRKIRHSTTKVCAERPHRDWGAGENQKEMYSSLRGPNLIRWEQGRHLTASPSFPPSASPTLEGSVTAATSPVPPTSKLFCTGEQEDLTLNQIWNKNYYLEVYILILELKTVLCLKVTRTLKWTCYLKVSQKAMGKIFKRTMGETDKVVFCLHPRKCNLQFF